MTMKPISSSRFAAAYALDLIAGDPQSMPHPVRLMGAAVRTGETLLRSPASPAEEILRGALLTGIVVGGSFATVRVIVRATGPVGEIALAWTALATRCLLHESRAVLDALDSGDIVLARNRLAMIVGRDTDYLDEPEIARAVIETIAEGLCDGIVAPLFYLAVGGVPLAMAYKAVNTLDSMIGHLDPPYRYFGRVAARLDDAVNFIPARLAAMAIIGSACLTRHNGNHSLAVLLRDGRKHPSPNAGRTEATMAGALGVRLGGMNYYDGKPEAKPILGASGRIPTRSDGRAAIRVAAVASGVVFSAMWLLLRWRERKT